MNKYTVQRTVSIKPLKSNRKNVNKSEFSWDAWILLANYFCFHSHAKYFCQVRIVQFSSVLCEMGMLSVCRYCSIVLFNWHFLPSSGLRYDSVALLYLIYCISTLSSVSFFPQYFTAWIVKKEVVLLFFLLLFKLHFAYLTVIIHFFRSQQWW